MADRRDAILAKLDEYALDHQPMLGSPETGCCPGGCIGDAVVALRAVLAETDQWLPAGRSGAASVEQVIAEALGIPAEEAGQC